MGVEPGEPSIVNTPMMAMCVAVGGETGSRMVRDEMTGLEPWICGRYRPAAGQCLKGMKGLTQRK